MSVLNTDTLVYVLSFLGTGKDAASLRNVLLVSRFFFDLAARILYREVVYSPAYSRVLNLGRAQRFVKGKAAAARLPRYAQHVLKFEISGYLWYKRHRTGAFAAEVTAAIKHWPNLRTVVLAPEPGNDENLTAKVLTRLSKLCRLRHLTVSGSCIEDAHAHLLLNVGHLETLSIANPTGAMLNVLPQWLEKLSTFLKSFALRDNCGSVTPGVLHSFTPHVHEITSFSLGLSDSLTNDDVFAFLNGLPCLQSLELRYYLLRTPAIPPVLPHLRHVTIHHQSVATKPQANNLCTWARLLVVHSPVISLRMVGEDVDRYISVTFDGLIDSLAASHCRSLRALRMDSAFVGHKALLRLIASCPLLEELGISTTIQGVAALESNMRSLDRLHVLVVKTRNIKPKHVVVDDARVLNFFVEGKVALRYLRINRSAWRGLWESTSNRNVQFKITRLG